MEHVSFPKNGSPNLFLRRRCDQFIHESFGLLFPVCAIKQRQDNGVMGMEHLSRSCTPIGIFFSGERFPVTPDGKCPEGIGIIPDVIVQNTKADIDAGNDKVLQCAIRYLSQ